MIINIPDNQVPVLLQILEMAAEEFARHGCNDFALPMSEDSIALMNLFECANVGVEQHPEQVHVFDASKTHIPTQDWIVMRAFYAKFEIEFRRRNLMIDNEDLVAIFRRAVYGDDWAKQPGAVLDSEHTLKGVRAVLQAFARR